MRGPGDKGTNTSPMHVSASQVEAFLRCNRYWWNKSGLKLPEPFKPAAAKGGRVHKVIEYFLKSGLIGQTPGVTDEDIEIAQKAIKGLPPRGDELLVEHEFRLPTYDGGPEWLGYIDLLDLRQKPLFVGDHKTRSDNRYFSKPEDLLKDVQMVSYAKYVQDTYEVDEVVVAHLYTLTKSPYRTTRIDALLNRKQVAAVWTGLMPAVRAMMEWRALAPKTADVLEPNSGACGAYGGCAYKPLCGFSPNVTFTIKNMKKGDVKTMSENGEVRKLSLSEKLALKKKEALAAAGTAPPVEKPAEKPAEKPKAPPPKPAVGVSPPDAPEDRADPPPADDEETPAEAPAAKKKKKSSVRDNIMAQMEDEETPPTPPPAETKTERKPPVTLVPKGEPAGPEKPATALDKFKLHIYVDCLPIKGAEGEHQLFEDWFAPIAALIAEEQGVADYRMMQFAGWKPIMAKAIRDCLDTLPPVLVMSSYGPGVQEALDVLTPYATKITKKFG